MYRIQVFNKISDKGLSCFPSKQYHIANDLNNPDIILLRSYNLHDNKPNDELLAVGRAGAGVNNIPIDRYTQLGIPVFNTPGANAGAVKELVIAGLLLAARNISESLRFIDQLKQQSTFSKPEIEAAKKQFVGSELQGKTLGVIGLGAIGVQVANAAQQLGMKIMGYDPYLTVQRAITLSSALIPADSVEHLLSQSDFVSLHVPLMGNTRNLINAENITSLKPGSVLINFSREEIVSEEAVISALKQKKLNYYVSDFPSIELLKQDNVICLPHLGASTKEAEENCAVMIATQIRDYIENGIAINAVNFPVMKLPVKTTPRLCVVNENKPDMVAQISHSLGQAKVNIAAMRNDSKDQLAYTVLDLDKIPNEATIDSIKNIEGVLRLRLLS